ncbi:MAG: hypothetical protein JNK14_21520 [Chitinophagaceae bacterium]|nr:hypothetical protein [Chitinophagaceae bacterium]
MKKIFLFVAILALVVSVQAQNYESIKNFMILQQYKKAKEDLDKQMGNAKFTAKPEAYILKAAIYSGLASDAAVKATPEGAQMLTDADAAFKKFKEMDPTMALLKDAAYQNAPINIYSGFFSAGYKDYETKSYQTGFEKFKKVVEYSDLLIEKKFLSVPVDTNALLLAGILAENAGSKEEAVKYYVRLADIKAKGDGFESIYRLLVNHHFLKKDMANFEKYKATGAELYPESEFFKYDKVDFAVGLEEDFNKKLSSLESTIAGDPTNYKAVRLLGELIYDTLNSRHEGAVQPANAAEWESKMIQTFTKAAELKAGDEMPFIYIGDHFVNKSIKANDARTEHAAAMKTRTKPGVAASKEDIAKRDALDNAYGEALDKAREPYEKAAAIFAKKEKLTGHDKQQYKKVVGYLGDIYMNKKIRANREKKTADAAKFAAEEKKWNDAYDTIK